MSVHFFSRELRDGLYLVSADEWTQPDSSVNCYLVVGPERALLVDAGMPGSGNLRAFVERLAQGLPVDLVATHGHFDHVGHASEFEALRMNKNDLRWLDGVGYIPGIPVKVPVLPLDDGDIFDLGGGRTLTVVGIPGHTVGSMGLLDHITRTLIAGDSIARRGFIVEEQGAAQAIVGQFDRLLEVERMDFDALATAHDRYLLPKGVIRHVMRAVADNVESPQKYWTAPDGTAYAEVRLGEPEDDYYVNYSFPEASQPLVAEALATWKDSHPYVWTEE